MLNLQHHDRASLLTGSCTPSSERRRTKGRDLFAPFLEPGPVAELFGREALPGLLREE